MAMAREASSAYLPHTGERSRPREITFAETLQAQEDARSYVGEHIAMEREAMFVRASRGMSPEKVAEAQELVMKHEFRFKNKQEARGAGGELIEIAGYLAGKLDMLGKNARVVPTAKFDDYRNSVDFVIEWDVPGSGGKTETRRVGVDFKGIRADLDNVQQRKEDVLRDTEREPMRDLEFTVSPAAGEQPRYDRLSVAIIPVFVDMRDMQRFYDGLVDPHTRALPDVLDQRIQSGLKQKFARDPFRGTLLKSLRENIGTQLQALEQSKNTFKGNETELRKIDQAIQDLKGSRDIIDLQRRELGIGEVVPLRSREQQEHEAKEKVERTQANKSLDEIEKRTREFFKDVRSVFGVSPEEYLSTRKVAQPPRSSSSLLEGNYDPAVLKKITKRLPKEPVSTQNDHKAKQIGILLEKSPLANEKYMQAKQILEAFRASHPDIQENDGSLASRIEEYLRNDRLAESLMQALRSDADASRAAA